MFKAQTNFEKVSDTQILFNITDASTINHIVVFLTGEIAFPENMGGSVFFHVSQDSLEPNLQWKYIGYLSNEKPSAIFKISDKSKITSSFTSSLPQHKPAQVGISIDSLTNILSLEQLHHPQINNSAIMQLSQNHTPNNDEKVEYCVKMLQNFYHYASSFAASGESIKNALSLQTFDPQNTDNLNIATISKDGRSTYFPTSALEQWYKNFMNKIKINPNFWKSISND
ncbi:unnamed protein product [Gordionus sp. m RMFG-2023]